MRFKRALSASMAGVMAISSAVVFNIDVGAEEYEIAISNFKSNWGSGNALTSGSLSFTDDTASTWWCQGNGLENYAQLVVEYTGKTASANDGYAQIGVQDCTGETDADKKAVTGSLTDTAGKVTIDISSLETVDQIFIQGKNCSLEISKIYLVSAVEYGDEKTLWSGSYTSSDNNPITFGEENLSGLSDDAVFTITLSTTGTNNEQKGWGIGQIVANNTWTESKTVQISSPGQNMSDQTITTTLKAIKETSGETSLTSLIFQLYTAGPKITKITVKDVKSETTTLTPTLTAEAVTGATSEEDALAKAKEAASVTFDVEDVPTDAYTLDVALSEDKKSYTATLALTDAGKELYAFADGAETTTTGTITYAVDTITLDKTELGVIVGKDAALTATVTPADLLTDDAKKVTWTSSDTSVATVADGKVTGVKAGTATITAEAGEKTATCKVTVTADTVAVTDVSLDKTSLELEEGAAGTLTATVAPAAATDTTVTWTSSDTGVATVDKNGEVTAVEAGTATITVTTTDGKKTAECKVTVTEKKEESTVTVSNNYIDTTWSTWLDGVEKNVEEGSEIRIQYEAGTAADYHQLKIISGDKVLSSVEGADATYGTVSVTGEGELTIKLNKEDAALIKANGFQVGGYDVTVKNILVNVEKDKDVAAASSTKVVDLKTTADSTGKIANMYAILAITEEDAKNYSGFKITVTRSKDDKKIEVEVTEYSDQLFYDLDGTMHEINAGDGVHLIGVDLVNGNTDMGNITVTITPIEG